MRLHVYVYKRCLYAEVPDSQPEQRIKTESYGKIQPQAGGAWIGGRGWRGGGRGGRLALIRGKGRKVTPTMGVGRRGWVGAGGNLTTHKWVTSMDPWAGRRVGGGIDPRVVVWVG